MPRTQPFKLLTAIFRRCLAITLAAVAATATPATAQEQKTLSLYNWPNYFPPNLLRRFEAETGIHVQLGIYDSNEQMLERIRKPDHGYDLVVPSDYAAAQMIQEGLVETLDASALPNFANVLPPHDAPSFDPARKFTAPYMWGTVGFAYDSKAVGNAPVPESWSVLFEPPTALQGRIAMLDDEVEVFSAAAYYLGLDPCSGDEAQHGRILELLEKQAASVAEYDSNGTVTRMLTGAVAAHMQWNTSAHRVRQSRQDVVYVYPQEGLHWWQDNFAIPRGAPNIEAARTFVNWMLSPRNAAEASNFTGYMNAVRGSAEFLEPALREDPAINMPEGYADRLRTAPVCPSAIQNMRHELWQKLRGAD